MGFRLRLTGSDHLVEIGVWEADEQMREFFRVCRLIRKARTNSQRSHPMSQPKKRILILGGGFGGVYAAVHLGKMLTAKEHEEYEIGLVSRENYIVFQPLLPEVISGSVELNHVIAPIRRMAPRANLYTRDIESIDPVARTV